MSSSLVDSASPRQALETISAAGSRMPIARHRRSADGRPPFRRLVPLDTLMRYAILDRENALATEASSATSPGSRSGAFEVLMIFRQLFHQGSSTYTYLLADERTREAVLIDSVFEEHDRDAALI